MFGKIGIGQLLIVIALFVIFFGFKRMPEFGRGLGQALRNFKKGLSGEDEIDITPKTENPNKNNQ